MQERYLATADMGSGKIGLCVAKVTGKNINILYFKEHPSAGVRHSCVYNPAKAGAALRDAILDAENELNIDILQVVVGLPRYGFRQEIASARLECNENLCITEEDIAIVKNEALSTYPVDDADTEIIYGAVAQSFSTDELVNASEEDAVGTTSKFLDGNFKVFVGPRKALTNIDTMLEKANVSCAGKIFLPDATARVILNESELDNGVALVEMGAGVTSLTIYQGNIMRYYSAIPFGGRTITGDIKYECGFQESLAESIKLEWGACMPEKLQNIGDKILQINDDHSGTYEHLPVKYLSEIISARAKEIIEAILYEIHDSGFAKRLRCGIVLTGGGAEMVNLAAYIRDLTGFNVRIGYPCSSLIEDSEYPLSESPEASASIGLLLCSAISLPKLNCLQSAPVTPVRTEISLIRKNDIKEQDGQEEEEEEYTYEGQSFEIIQPENMSGTVFENYQDEQTAENVRPEKSKKVKEPRKRGTRNIIWGQRFKSGMDAIGNMVGELFENIEE